MILPTSAASTSVHAKGIADLLQLHSPEYYKTGVAHQLFVGFRPVLLIHAFAFRQSTFLAMDCWLSIPFSTCPPSYLQHLLSSTIGLPEILGIIDGLSSLPEEESVLTAQRAFETLSAAMDGLAETRQMLEDDCLDLMPIHPTNRLEILHFPSITAANLYTHLWAFELLCILHIRRLIAMFPFPVQGLSLRIDEATLDVKEEQCIILILRSTEYLMKEDFRLYGAASVVLPLGVASEALRCRLGRERGELHYWHTRVVSFVSGKGYPFVTEKFSAAA
jgi:hypothetical protein